MKPLLKFADDVGAPLLVLHDASSVNALEGVAPDWEVRPLSGPLPDRRRWAGVAVVVTDRRALRSAVDSLPPLGPSRAVACFLVEDDQPIHLVPRPEWPPVTRLQARRLSSGGAVTLLHLDAPVPVHAVLRELARVSGTSRPSAGRIVLASSSNRPRLTLPPEIVVRTDSHTPVTDYDPEVAPTPTVVTDEVLGRGPLDEGVLNPIGFHSDPDHGIALLPPGEDVTHRTVATLRTHQGLRVDWADPTPELARTVAALAMTGIPLVAGAPPSILQPWLGEALCAVLAQHVDLSDPLGREEHSIRLRRAALLTHSGPGWLTRVAAAAGRTLPRFPTCSVVLATRRAHQLDSALRNVARQRGVDVELVVAAHGFEPDAARVRAQIPDLPVEVLSLPEDAIFGDVLTAGVAASSGDIVVKMDDDDFYGPDFLLDLLLAREYSGADVVGTSAEFVYLEDLDRTIRRQGTARDASERFTHLVAGGTISIPRALLDEVGGFQAVRRLVDHQLFHAVQSVGGSIYRTHGLGFMLRRTSGGHTWHVGDDHFLDPNRLHDQWEGFVPTGILEPDDQQAI